MGRPGLIWFPTMSAIANTAIPFVAFTLLMWDAVHEPVYQQVSRITVAGMVFQALAVRLVVFLTIALVSLASAAALVRRKSWARWILAIINLCVSIWLVVVMWEIWSPALPFPRTEDVFVLTVLIINLGSVSLLFFSRSIQDYLNELPLRPPESAEPPPPPDFTD
jgi:hypothetical protein